MAGSAKRLREYSGPMLFARGFRPFFLGGALFAALVMPIWSLMLVYDVSMPSHLGGRAWHLHEMIYGYVGAIIAGFLLTAIPNWTGRLPVVGGQLALLWAVWIAGRLAMVFSEISPIGAAIIDSSFLVLLAGVLLREIIAGNNKKNLPIGVMISLLAISNIVFHVKYLADDPTALFERAALGIIAILISLIGGRITPSFTRNWMVKQDKTPLPASMGILDYAVMFIGVVTIVAWVVFPERRLVGLMFIAAGLAYVVRMARWRGFATLSEPLVFVLHVGYFWLPVWFALMGLAILYPDILDHASALHALSAGAIGVMTMAVATRASLGHSDRELSADTLTVSIYVFLVAGTILRIIAHWLPFDYSTIVAVSGVVWAAGMGAFVIGYAPLLLGRK